MRARNNVINLRVKREKGINNHTEIFDFINYPGRVLIGLYFTTFLIYSQY